MLISIYDKGDRDGIQWVPAKQDEDDASLCRGCLYSVDGHHPSDEDHGNGMNLCDLYSDRIDYCIVNGQESMIAVMAQK